MTSYLQELNSQRDAITSEIEGIESAMSVLGSGSHGTNGRAKRGPGRPSGTVGRPGSLKPMIVQVLKQRSTPMSPTQIASAVIKAGYKTKTDNLTKAVSNALPDIRGVRKVSRGQYSA